MPLVDELKEGTTLRESGALWRSCRPPRQKSLRQRSNLVCLLVSAAPAAVVQLSFDPVGTPPLGCA